MKLYYPIFNEKIDSLKEKMEEMVISHQLVERPDNPKLLLEFGKDRIEEFEAIQNYLEELHRDMQLGYYCAC